MLSYLVRYCCTIIYENDSFVCFQSYSKWPAVNLQPEIVVLDKLAQFSVNI